MAAQSRLHLIGGGTVDVDQPPKDAARMLWGQAAGDDAHDMGYAALQHDAETLFVNPSAVAYVEAKPSGRAQFS